MLRFKNVLLFSLWRAEPLLPQMNAIIRQQTHWQTGATQSASETKAQEAHDFSQMKHTQRKLPLGDGAGHVSCSQGL